MSHSVSDHLLLPFSAAMKPSCFLLLLVGVVSVSASGPSGDDGEDDIIDLYSRDSAVVHMDHNNFKSLLHGKATRMGGGVLQQLVRTLSTVRAPHGSESLSRAPVSPGKGRGSEWGKATC